MATTVTAPVAKIRSALQQVAKSMKQGVDGAEILGAYLEGPYFTEKNKGAHPTTWFRDLSVEELDNWISYADNHLITVALAPEKQGQSKRFATYVNMVSKSCSGIPMLAMTKFNKH